MLNGVFCYLAKIQFTHQTAARLMVIFIQISGVMKQDLFATICFAKCTKSYEGTRCLSCKSDALLSNYQYSAGGLTIRCQFL